MKALSCIAAILFITLPLYGGNAEFFEKVEFHGVINADKYKIVQDSGAKGNNKGIFIDTDRLKEVLAEHVLVKSYNVTSEGRTLLVEVEEKYPVFMTLMIDKQQSFPALVDEKLNIIETGLFFRTDMPIIIMRKEFSENENGFAAVMSIFELLRKLNSEKRDFVAEMEEVTIHSGSELKVKLRKRKTLFVIKNELNGFTRLEKTAAYLDIAQRYPDILDLRGNMALVR